MIANSSGSISYSQNMNKATAFEGVVRKISEQHLEEDEAHDDYKANPQVVPLPYPVEQTIFFWEVQAFPYEDNAFLKDLSGDQQYVFVLSATLKKIETRRSTRNKGIFRIFKTPSKSSTYVEDDDMDDEYKQIGVRDAKHWLVDEAISYLKKIRIKFELFSYLSVFIFLFKYLY